MARKPGGAQEETTPKEFPQTSPPIDLYATSDIRFVMMELGKLGQKVDRLIDDVGKVGDRLNLVERAVDRVKTAAIVAVAILGVVGAVFWWALGDRITQAVQNGLFHQQDQVQSAAPAVPPPSPASPP